MSITIKTHLANGIYKSSGGGETRTHYEFSTGPRNLLKAIEKLIEHRRDMENGYGNIGCGSSWLEIDGVRIHRFDLEEVATGDDPREFAKMYSCLKPKSKTQKALDLLAEVAAGSYDGDKYN